MQKCLLKTNLCRSPVNPTDRLQSSNKGWHIAICEAATKCVQIASSFDSQKKKLRNVIYSSYDITLQHYYIITCLYIFIAS